MDTMTSPDGTVADFTKLEGTVPELDRPGAEGWEAVSLVSTWEAPADKLSVRGQCERQRGRRLCQCSDSPERAPSLCEHIAEWAVPVTRGGPQAVFCFVCAWW